VLTPDAVDDIQVLNKARREFDVAAVTRLQAAVAAWALVQGTRVAVAMLAGFSACRIS
jgi:hypothetical protein